MNILMLSSTKEHECWFVQSHCTEITLLTDLSILNGPVTVTSEAYLFTSTKLKVSTARLSANIKKTRKHTRRVYRITRTCQHLQSFCLYSHCTTTCSISSYPCALHSRDRTQRYQSPIQRTLWILATLVSVSSGI